MTTLLRPGDLVDGYEVLTVLGKGGMGAVYRVRRGENSYALKTQLVLGNSPDVLARFQREAELLASLNHENLVRVHAAGRLGSAAYFIMSLIEGESLDERIRRGPLPAREALAILLPIARAVAYAHERKIIHRDIKPANVLIEKDTGRPFLADFGLARQVDERDRLTRTGEILGTPTYLSPEQALGVKEDLDEKTDVYGLAATLYAALAGGPPFTGTSTVAILQKVCIQDPPPIPGVAPELQAVVFRGLAKKREHRPPSVASFVRQLEAIGAGEDEDDPSRRLRRLALVLVGAALLSVGALVGVIVRSREPRPPVADPSLAPTSSSGKPVPTSAPASAWHEALGRAIELAARGDREGARALVAKVASERSAVDTATWLALEAPLRVAPGEELAAFALSLATSRPTDAIVGKTIEALGRAPQADSPLAVEVRQRIFDDALAPGRERLARLARLDAFQPVTAEQRKQVAQAWLARAREVGRRLDGKMTPGTETWKALSADLRTFARDLRRATRADPEVSGLPEPFEDAFSTFLSLHGYMAQNGANWEVTFREEYPEHPIPPFCLGRYYASDIGNHSKPDSGPEPLRDARLAVQWPHLAETTSELARALAKECGARNHCARKLGLAYLTHAREKLYGAVADRWPASVASVVAAMKELAGWLDTSESWEAASDILASLGDEEGSRLARERAKNAQPLESFAGEK